MYKWIVRIEMLVLGLVFCALIYSIAVAYVIPEIKEGDISWSSTK